MRIDYEAIAEKAVDNVADWNGVNEAASMYRWVHADPARFDEWLIWATAQEEARLIADAHEAHEEARQTAREWAA